MPGLRTKLLALTTASALSALLAVTVTPAAEANDGHRATSTDPELLAHAKKVAPLNAVANALGEQGRGAFADTYSDLHIDEDHGFVTLYATDSTRAAKLVSAAEHAHPTIDTALIRVQHADYSRKVLDREIDKIFPLGTVKDASKEVYYGAAPNVDGSGLTVEVKPSALRRVKAQGTRLDGIPVTYVPGKVKTAASWRWNDSRPQIGGDVLIGNSRKSGYAEQCTSGIAAENSRGRDYLITAAHCYPNGAGVYGEGGSTPGHWTYTKGNYFGKVTSTKDEWDAQLIDSGLYNGRGFNSDEADKPSGKWYAVNNYAYSYYGQKVCQDGARSYYNGKGVPCNITTVRDDYRYTMTWEDGSTHHVRGVQGHGTYTCTQGDSGGLVFTINDGSHRQARGIVSANSGTDDIYWTEATDILHSFGLKLNPHQ
ncbi:chymotrypsin family serine protease [Streptomyces avermitilis]|uniref:hypothetical protein n=1 Tax=Streptomyces avermitilis TaxID=33903 RepID=UPI003690EAA1